MLQYLTVLFQNISKLYFYVIRESKVVSLSGTCTYYCRSTVLGGVNNRKQALQTRLYDKPYLRRITSYPIRTVE
jgi:hypothetical protein